MKTELPDRRIQLGRRRYRFSLCGNGRKQLGFVRANVSLWQAAGIDSGRSASKKF
jgi:hypothetical protein